MNENGVKKAVNRRERISAMVYVTIIFGIGVGLIAWILFSGSDLERMFVRKDFVNAKMERQLNFRRAQEKGVVMCDMLTERINKYDPGLNAVYEKNDIQFLIGEMSKQHEQNATDKRYTVFLHMSEFYYMWFNDKQHIWSLKTNESYLKQNLEECELGLEKKKEELKVKK